MVEELPSETESVFPNSAFSQAKQKASSRGVFGIVVARSFCRCPHTDEGDEEEFLVSLEDILSIQDGSDGRSDGGTQLNVQMASTARQPICSRVRPAAQFGR